MELTFYPSSTSILKKNLSILIKKSDSNGLIKKKFKIEDFHSIIEQAKDSVNDIYDKMYYSRDFKSLTSRKVKKKENKIKITINPKIKLSLINQSFFTTPKHSIRNKINFNKTLINNKIDNKKIVKKISSRKSIFLNSEKKLLEEINKVNRNLDELNEKSELKINNKSTSISEEKINYQLMNKNNNKEKEIINTNYENNKSYIPNLKKVKSNKIINGIININSSLGKVYTKCLKNIQLGEKEIKYIDEQKLKSNIQNKIKDEKYKIQLTQLEDRIFLEKLDKTSFQKKMEKSHINILNLTSNFDPQKISNKFAFNNRKEYYNVFKGKYTDDEDFIFKNEYLRISEANSKFKLNKNIEKQQKRHEKIEKLLKNDLRDKNLLLERLERDKKKYYTKDYFFNKNKNVRNNSSLNINNTEYLKLKQKILRKQFKNYSTNTSLAKLDKN